MPNAQIDAARQFTRLARGRGDWCEWNNGAPVAAGQGARRSGGLGPGARGGAARGRGQGAAHAGADKKIPELLQKGTHFIQPEAFSFHPGEAIVSASRGSRLDSAARGLGPGAREAQQGGGTGRHAKQHARTGQGPSRNKQSIRRARARSPRGWGVAYGQRTRRTGPGKAFGAAGRGASGGGMAHAHCKQTPRLRQATQQGSTALQPALSTLFHATSAPATSRPVENALVGRTR